MEELFDLRAQIKIAKDLKDWQRVKELSGVLLEKFPVQATPWDKYWLARAYAETGNPDKADQLCNKLLSVEPGFEPCKNLKVKILWHKLKTTDEILLADNLFNTLKHLTDNEFWIATAVLELAAKKLKKNRFEAALRLLEQHRHLNYSDEPRFDRQNHRLPSQYEAFYSKMMKCYVKLGYYEEAVNLYKSINPDKFGPNLKKWMKYHYALSLSGTGDHIQALDILFRMPEAKKQWFVWLDIAKTTEKLGNKEAALYFAIFSLINFGKIDIFKTKALDYTAKLLMEQDKSEEAKILLCCALQLYKNQNFKPNPSILQALTKLGINFEDDFCGSDACVKSKKLLHELIYEENFEGSIISVKDKYGFIRYNGGKTLYFFIGNFKSDKKLAKKGQKVRFNIGWTYDRNKRQINKQAINIQAVS